METKTNELYDELQKMVQDIANDMKSVLRDLRACSHENRDRRQSLIHKSQSLNEEFHNLKTIMKSHAPGPEQTPIDLKAESSSAKRSDNLRSTAPPGENLPPNRVSTTVMSDEVQKTRHKQEMSSEDNKLENTTVAHSTPQYDTLSQENRSEKKSEILMYDDRPLCPPRWTNKFTMHKRPPNGSCRICGDPTHWANICRFKQQKKTAFNPFGYEKGRCFNCGQSGHRRESCTLPPRTAPTSHRHQQRGYPTQSLGRNFGDKSRCRSRTRSTGSHSPYTKHSYQLTGQDFFGAENMQLYCEQSTSESEVARSSYVHCSGIHICLCPDSYLTTDVSTGGSNWT